MEQEEYKKEEIDWSYIEFVDNQDVLDLIEKKPGGIISLLDEACMFPRSTHETFAQKLYQTFKNHKRFSKPKLSRSDFTICHYAGDVTYQTDLFLDKNKDYVVAEHQALLNASKCPFVSGLFPPSPEESSKQSKFSSIGARFKQQLQALLETLSATEPHYIRCVKPNNLLKPSIFENKNVLQQLRCGGVMEAIRISCAGYPTRKTFDEFVDRFGLLAPEALAGRYLSCSFFLSYPSDEVAACKRILDKVGLKGYQIGKTKVFLRAGQMAELDTRRSEVLGKSASIIQRKIQAACRGQLARQVYEGLRQEASSLMIQRYFRMHIARKAYKELYSSAISIQTGMRGMAARCELRFRKQTRAAIVIQSHCRKYLAQHHFMNLKKAAITTQCAWRGKVARRELRKLKMAARETGALQAAKNKLEKQVEDLTLRLQLEKRSRIDMEEAKTQENKKLQAALQEMQLQFKETKSLLQKEREATKREAEKVPVIQEVPVVDNALLEKLTSENEKLKTLVSSLEKKIDETEKRYEEANKISEERLKQALDAESKIIQLKTAMQRLEEKFFDMESENQVLRQQSLLNSSVKTMSEHLSTHVSEKLENGHHVAEDLKAVETQSVTPVKKFGTESDSKLRRSFIERQHENVDALISCVMKNIGFHHGKPVAAFTIYKCLLHWKSFEAERTSVFDRLIQMIGSAIENQDDNDLMAYWLSNTSALLFLLQQSLKTGGATDTTPVRKPPNPTSLFGRMAMGFRSSPSSANLPAPLEVVRKVEAKYPALLFKQQLTAYVEKIYGILRDNLKKELASLLSLCIQAPRTSKGVLRSGRSFGKDSPMGHWQSIIESLNTLLCTLKENFVPPVLIQKIYTQTFSYINVQLFNSNGEYVKAGLAELELWCAQAKEEYAGSSWDELKHIRQAVGFLVIHQKYRISYDEIINDLCPIMSVQQLYRICTLYWDANYNTRSVLSSMRVLMAEDSNNAQSDSFLLDDSSSIPFSVDDLSTSLQEKEFSDMKPAEELLENPAFRFLNE
ncbi:P-loop containing nucleoside triphosphate hydrolase [Sesbania bispinosa]|nr:P-loop containing nucleoside triphosphate hydrolase [Sesbania bispinosa]